MATSTSAVVVAIVCGTFQKVFLSRIMNSDKFLWHYLVYLDNN
jgi:hypothetical protein